MPEPYIRLPDFLPDPEHADVLRYADLVYPTMQAAEVTPPADMVPHLDDEFRRARICFDISPIIHLFESRLRNLVPYACDRLGIDPYPVADLEAQLTVHEAGGYFRAHTDDGGVATASRRLSWVFYVREPPCWSFAGGHLVLHPGETVIVPEDNLLVVFPSPTMHEVEPVIRGRRLTCNGWSREAA